eukprot:4963825-Alexandrium_andersonii.AAC.1
MDNVGQCGVYECHTAMLWQVDLKFWRQLAMGHGQVWQSLGSKRVAHGCDLHCCPAHAGWTPWKH